MNEKHLVIIPGRARMLLFKYCDERNIEYRIVSQHYFPEGTPGGCTFRGKDYIVNVVGFESQFTKEELYKILEEITPQSFKN